MMNNVFPEDFYENEQRLDQRSGLTKRELFAAMMMQTMLSRLNNASNSDVVKTVAQWAVQAADSLLEELSSELEEDELSFDEREKQ